MSFFAPVDLVLLLSGILGFYAFQTKGRRRMLSFKISADGLYALYLFLLGGYAGALSVCIAVLGGAVQVVTPPHLLRKTIPYRFVIACLLSVVGAALLARNMTDLYPFAAVILSRFVELFHSTLIIRIGFFCASLPWLVYNYSNGFYLAMIFGIFMMGAILLGVFRNERRLPKDPIP